MRASMEALLPPPEPRGECFWMYNGTPILNIS